MTFYLEVSDSALRGVLQGYLNLTQRSRKVQEMYFSHSERRTNQLAASGPTRRR